ncbi:MAG: tripartite tricarboxylate transporter permease, partial [Lentisphaeria bacterium]|nr:tripartite tricarboxylate transporter permease [Lentisphaeria bacterium]
MIVKNNNDAGQIQLQKTRPNSNANPNGRIRPSAKPGAILPTVAFGIPGNGAMAILLGVFLIVGLRPGPEMLR